MMCNKNWRCLILLIIGVVLGIIVGYNEYLAVIPGIVTGLWIAFGIGIGALVLLALIALFACGRKERCICKVGYCLAIPAVETIITAIIYRFSYNNYSRVCINSNINRISNIILNNDNIEFTKISSLFSL